MCYPDPTALGIYSPTSDDSDLRHEVSQKTENLLAGDCFDLNYLDFYEDTMQVCLQSGEWDEVDRYARALEEYTAAEPITCCKLFIDRGRVLADHGRGNRSPEVIQELRRLREETSRAQLKFALPELEAALLSE